MREGEPLSRIAVKETERSFQEFDILVNGKKVHFLHAGLPSSPKLILLHGVTSSAEICYKDSIGPIADQGFQVFAPDLPGYGQSDEPEDYKTESYVDWLVDYMDEVGIEEVHGEGLSFGGGVVTGTALKHSKRIDKIALTNSIGFGELHVPFLDDLRMVRWITRLVQKEQIASRIFNLSVLPQAFLGFKHVLGERVKKPVKIAFNKYIGHKDYLTEKDFETIIDDKGYRTFFRWMAEEMTPTGPRTNYIPELERIFFPHRTLILRGGRDRLIGSSWAVTAHNLMANSVLHTFKDSKHGLPLQRPLDFAQVVGDFFSGKTEELAAQVA